MKKMILGLALLASFSSFAATVETQITAKYGSGVVRRDTISLSKVDLNNLLLTKEKLGREEIDKLFREFQQYPGTSRLTRHIVGRFAFSNAFGGGLPASIILEEIHVNIIDNGTSRYDSYTFSKAQMPAYERHYGFSPKLGFDADYYCLRNVSPCLNLGW